METNCVDRLMKKQKIVDSIAEIFQQNGMSYEQGIEYCKTLTRKFSINWISVMCSDWLSESLLQYLTIKDITRLDSSICNRNERTQWLNCLGKRCSNISLETASWSNALVNWIVARKLRFDDLYINEGYSKISNENMYRLAKQWPNLKRLVIVSDIEDGLDNDNNLHYLLAMCYNLKSIELDGFIFSHDHCVWLGACEQLEHIKFTGSNLSSALNIKNLFRNKKRLKMLELGDICNAELLSELGMNCPLLEELNVEYLKDALPMHIEAFVQGCTNLKILKLYDIRNNSLSTVDLRSMLIEGLGNNCHSLESFYLQSECDNISESALKSLAQGCLFLNEFSIDKARIVPAQGVKHLVDHCSKLHSISISYSEISDEVLVELGRIKILRRLNISGSRKITDVGIKALVKENGKKLIFLDIGNCRSLTDASLSSIIDHCPHLRTLTLRNNHKDMTTVGMMRLIQKCQELCFFSSNDRNTSSVDRALINRLMDERRMALQS